MQDYHELPKLRDSLSYLFAEHVVVERDQHSIELIQKSGRTHVPAANLSLLLLGPGTSISHAAVKLLAESGCSILWTGEDGIRLYAQGVGETRRAFHLLHQADMLCDPVKHKAVVLRMYAKRFGYELDSGLSLPQIRGKEGVRMRSAYARAAEKYHVKWQGRLYNRAEWNSSDPINRALSAANALLNGLCHAAVVSGGYSAALGFVHTGKQLSFVYDIADLYKTEITIPAAFQTVSESDALIERRVRMLCRQMFYDAQLLKRVLDDIDQLLQTPAEPERVGDIDSDGALPEPLWEELLDEPGGDAWS